MKRLVPVATGPLVVAGCGSFGLRAYDPVTFKGTQSLELDPA